MIVSPELMSASSAPSARPLKNCEPNWDQEIVMQKFGAAAGAGPAAPYLAGYLGVVAEVAAERVGLLHESRARNDLEDGPEVLLVLHLGRLLALDDDDRPHELVVFLAEVHLAHGGLDL